MSADRTEKLVITRTNSGTVVKVSILEDGVLVNYSVKTYESAVSKGIQTARAGAERLLGQAKEVSWTKLSSLDEATG